MQSMTTRIEQRFEDLNAAGQSGFIAYITAGDPSLLVTEDVVLRLEDAGTDVIELGVPFSDPLADGPANQRAAERALAAGTTLPQVLDSVARLRERTEIPLIIYSYMNPLVAPGFENTVAQIRAAGIDGILMVDLSVEESAPYARPLTDAGLNIIYLVTPTTPDDRIKMISDQSSGFVYCVSRTGVTGAQAELQKDALTLLDRVHAQSDLPVALGFGVSTPDQARAYAEITEAVVVGSYIVNAYHEAGDSAEGRAKATHTVKRLIDAVKQA